MYPRECTSRVLMQEMLTSLQLSTIEVTTEVEVCFTVLNCRTHFVDWHLAIVHLSIPNAESSAGWRPYNPLRIIVGYHPTRQLAVFRLVEVPRTATKLICPEVKGSETLQLSDLRFRFASDTIVP